MRFFNGIIMLVQLGLSINIVFKYRMVYIDITQPLMTDLYQYFYGKSECTCSALISCNIFVLVYSYYVYYVSVLCKLGI